MENKEFLKLAQFIADSTVKGESSKQLAQSLIDNGFIVFRSLADGEMVEKYAEMFCELSDYKWELYGKDNPEEEFLMGIPTRTYWINKGKKLDSLITASQQVKLDKAVDEAIKATTDACNSTFDAQLAEKDKEIDKLNKELAENALDGQNKLNALLQEQEADYDKHQKELKQAVKDAKREEQNWLKLKSKYYGILYFCCLICFWKWAERELFNKDHDDIVGNEIKERLKTSETTNA